MKRDYPFIVFATVVVLFLICNTTWMEIFGDTERGYRFYYRSLSLMITGVMWYVRCREKERSFVKYLFADLFFNLAATKLFTELFYDATTYQIYEYINLVICLIILVARIIIRK